MQKPFIFDIFDYLVYFVILLIILRVAKYIYKLIKEKRILKKLASSGIRDIDKMDGFQFEVYLKALFKELGYKPIVTNSSHDFGADLILKKDKEKIAIQAKRYGIKNKVGIGAIQEIYAAKAYYQAHEAWVITNSLYTKSAFLLAKACNVKLYDRQKLVEFINRSNAYVQPKEIYNTVEPKERKCPICSSKLIKRTNKNGNHFMGCERFPHCRHTEQIASN